MCVPERRFRVTWNADYVRPENSLTTPLLVSKLEALRLVRNEM